IKVGFNSPKPNCKYTEYGMRFMLAPKSNTALSILCSPTVMLMLKLPGSFNLGGILCNRTALAVSEICTFSSFPNLFFLLVSFLKNFAYEGMFLIKAKRGRLIISLESISKILEKILSLLFSINRLGKGTLGLKSWAAVLHSGTIGIGLISLLSSFKR